MGRDDNNGKKKIERNTKIIIIKWIVQIDVAKTRAIQTTISISLDSSVISNMLKKKYMYSNRHLSWNLFCNNYQPGNFVSFSLESKMLSLFYTPFANATFNLIRSTIKTKSTNLRNDEKQKRLRRICWKKKKKKRNFFGLVFARIFIFCVIRSGLEVYDKNILASFFE